MDKPFLLDFLLDPKIIFENDFEVHNDSNFSVTRGNSLRDLNIKTRMTEVRMETTDDD